MTAERVTLDPNLLINAADDTAGARNKLAARLVLECARTDCVLSIQALSEFFRAVTRKGKPARAIAAKQVRDRMSTYPIIVPSAAVLNAALDLNLDGKSGYWGGVMIATAEQAGRTLLLSEDMHDGMRFRKLRIRNPFAGSHLAADIRALIVPGD
jgi:predicted nucleic acid-binding protein